MTTCKTFRITMTMIVDAVTASELQGHIDNESPHDILAMATDINITVAEEEAK